VEERHVLKDAVDAKTVKRWLHHWQDEGDAAHLYGLLAQIETDRSKQGLFTRLMEVEKSHVEVWTRVLREHGVETPSFRPSARTRLLAFLAGRFGPSFLTSLLLKEEGREVRAYLSLYKDSSVGPAKDAAWKLARESAEHAGDLAQLTSSGPEPWHRTGSGGFLRNVIYGFNDGLTANFGLVAGVIGATRLATQIHIVLVTGIAGAIADALSMGASGFLAAKSEQEVYENEIAMEKDEIELMPEVEEEELALIYEAKGMTRERAREFAKEVMQSSDRGLEEKVREELKIGEAHATPLREGWVTGLATAVGAFIPVFPFLILGGSAAVWVAFALAMASHFAVGATRSIFTGRGVLRSGIDMFVVGMGVALIGYLAGQALERVL
jgi:predicted membrane protein (TIGR00267 family)